MADDVFDLVGYGKFVREMSEKDLGRLFTKKRYKLSEEEMDTVDFISWQIYYAERGTLEIFSGTAAVKLKDKAKLKDEFVGKLFDKLC